MTPGTRCPAKEEGWHRGHRAAARPTGLAQFLLHHRNLQLLPVGFPQEMLPAAVSTACCQGQAQGTGLEGAIGQPRAMAKPPQSAPPELRSEHERPRQLRCFLSAQPGLLTPAGWGRFKAGAVHCSAPSALPAPHLGLLHHCSWNPNRPAGNGRQQGDGDALHSVSERSREQTMAAGRAGGGGGRGERMGGQEKRKKNFTALQSMG